MKGVIAGVAAACALAFVPAALADNVVLHPNSSGAHTVASWRAMEGQSDTVGSSNQALWLEKDDGDSTVYAAATFIGLEGQKVQSLKGLDWQRRKDGDCNKVAPRWTLGVRGKSGREYLVRFGCAQSAHSPGSAPGWIRDTNSQTLIRTRLLRAGGTDALAGTIESLAIVYDQRGAVGYTVLDNIRVISGTAGLNVWTCAADNAATLPGPPAASYADDLSVNPFTDSELLTLEEIWPTMSADDQAIASSDAPVE
jgi:hypothetical protein